MAIAYVLAHFDDEYAALPLILRREREGVDQRFFYLTDYATPEISRVRLAETRALLASLGVDPDHARHIGLGSGAQDGALHRHLPTALARLEAALAAEPFERLVVPAWEGGHHDHDACAFMAVRLAAGRPVEQFGLYQGRGLPGPLFRASAPLAENGPITRERLSVKDWLRFAAAVRFFPSQAKTWAGLWPMMFAQYLLAGGFAWQQLDAQRVRERPHPGSLLYERRFGVDYEDLRAALDAL